jgi:hypothetical protein
VAPRFQDFANCGDSSAHPKSNKIVQDGRASPSFSPASFYVVLFFEQLSFERASSGFHFGRNGLPVDPERGLREAWRI